MSYKLGNNLQTLHFLFIKKKWYVKENRENNNRNDKSHDLRKKN